MITESGFTYVVRYEEATYGAHFGSLDLILHFCGQMPFGIIIKDNFKISHPFGMNPLHSWAAASVERVEAPSSGTLSSKKQMCIGIVVGFFRDWHSVKCPEGWWLVSKLWLGNESLDPKFNDRPEALVKNSFTIAQHEWHDFEMVQVWYSKRKNHHHFPCRSHLSLCSSMMNASSGKAARPWLPKKIWHVQLIALASYGLHSLHETM